MKSKYIIILANENKFMNHMFDGETMQRESRITWSSLTPFARTEFINMVERIRVERNDGLFGVSLFEKENNDGFQF